MFHLETVVVVVIWFAANMIVGALIAGAL